MHKKPNQNNTQQTKDPKPLRRVGAPTGGGSRSIPVYPDRPPFILRTSTRECPASSSLHARTSHDPSGPRTAVGCLPLTATTCCTELRPPVARLNVLPSMFLPIVW